MIIVMNLEFDTVLLENSSSILLLENILRWIEQTMNSKISSTGDGKRRKTKEKAWMKRCVSSWNIVENERKTRRALWRKNETSYDKENDIGKRESRRQADRQKKTEKSSAKFFRASTHILQKSVENISTSFLFSSLTLI